MKRFIPVLFALLIPAALFAQGRKLDENSLLKGFGLNDGQISQVQAIEKTTRDAVKADFTHIRLVQAQIAEALLPTAAGPDAQAVNALIEKKGQFRTDIDKTLMSARLQLLKILGNDNYAKYAAYIRGRMQNRFRNRRPAEMLMPHPVPQGAGSANP